MTLGLEDQVFVLVTEDGAIISEQNHPEEQEEEEEEEEEMKTTREDVMLAYSDSWLWRWFVVKPALWAFTMRHN